MSIYDLVMSFEATTAAIHATAAAAAEAAPKVEALASAQRTLLDQSGVQGIADASGQPGGIAPGTTPAEGAASSPFGGGFVGRMKAQQAAIREQADATINTIRKTQKEIQDASDEAKFAAIYASTGFTDTIDQYLKLIELSKGADVNAASVFRSKILGFEDYIKRLIGGLDFDYLKWRRGSSAAPTYGADSGTTSPSNSMGAATTDLTTAAAQGKMGW